MTALQRRRADAERKRRQRQAARAAGRPSADQVYHAIAEATSFSLLCADRRAWVPEHDWQPVNVTVIINAAVDILDHRCGFDRAASKKAVIDVLRPRPPHRNAGFVPSVVVSPGKPAYPALAPEAAVRPQ